MHKYFASLSDEELIKVKLAMDNDTTLFARLILGGIVKEIPAYQQQIYSILDKRHLWNAFVLFRGAAKTTIGRHIKGLHDVLHTKEKSMLWISESIDQASADLVGIQDEVDGNEALKVFYSRFYGDIKGPVWNTEAAEFSNGVSIKVKGYGSRIRGIKTKAQRPTKIDLDDFESEKNTGRSQDRQAVSDWINRQVIPAGEVDKTVIFWGTIVHPEAFLAEAKKKEYFFPPTGSYFEMPIERDGISAWPERYSIEYIRAEEARMRAEGDIRGFRQEYYNEPAAFSKAVFNTSAVRELEGTFHKYGHITYIQTSTGKIPVWVYIGVDPASTFQATSSDTCFFVIGVMPSGKRVILDIMAEQVKTSEQRDIIFRLQEKWAPRSFTVETFGYQIALVDACREEMSKRNKYFSIQEFKRPYSKDRKFLEGVEPQINGGQVMYLSGVNVKKFFEQLDSYSAEEKDKNDTIDGYYLATLNARAPIQFDVDDEIRKLTNNPLGKKRKLTWYTR